MPKDGNEAEIRIIAHKVCLALRQTKLYQNLIQPPEVYGWDNNPFGI